MMVHPFGGTISNDTASCLCPSTYMNSDPPFQLACALSTCENVPDIGAFANTR